MVLMYVSWLALRGLQCDVDTAGRVARALIPSTVVREAARSADKFEGQPAWVASGLRGISAARVQQVLGAPRSTSVDRAVPGRQTWGYVVGSGDGSERWLFFEVTDGRVEKSYPMRITPEPAKWPHKLPGLRLEL